MRKFIVLLVLVTTLAAAGLVSAQPSNFGAHLTGANEVPANDSQAQGQVNLMFDSDLSVKQFKLNFTNLLGDVTGAHIHCAEVGSNGDVGVDLLSNASTNGASNYGTITDAGVAGGGWTSLTDVVDAITSGGAYVNVHSTVYPGGEIRGQKD
jgi:hypothetical protein